MQLKREAPTPLYIQLRDGLAAGIASGQYQPHDRLPSERELCEAYAVSRMTVRQAIAQLMHDGLVYARAGKGTFVNEPKINQELRSLTGFSQDVQARGGVPSSRVLEAQLLPATPQLAARLRQPVGTELVQLSRVRLSNAMPLALETAYLVHELCPQLLRYDFAVESLYHVLESDYGLRLVRAEQTMEASLANATELELLELFPPAAVLRLERLTYTDQDIPVEYVLSAYRGDRYKFRTALQPGS